MRARAHGSIRPCFRLLAMWLLTLCSWAVWAESAYVRVNQVGYETGKAPFRAYLMSTASETGASFRVINSQGATRYAGAIGRLLGTWSNSAELSYRVYALDFTVSGEEIYRIAVAGPVAADSPAFAVDSPDLLYPGLLLNTLFFYETERDGPNYIPNALRDAPGHLKDARGRVYVTPPLDSNDFIHTVPPAAPLRHAQASDVDAAGGWWDAGDYLKYVETTSYTVALMEIGIRDFPGQMGANAPLNPPIPPASVSYAGTSGLGAPSSSNFTAEARFGITWLMKMWNSRTKTLHYQVDNSQDWDYYGEGDPSSTASDCGGSYRTPFCLITEYDIWTLPPAADSFGEPEACDPLTTFYICYRPVFLAAPAGSKISPNLAGRLAADFSLCYQINQKTHSALANQCLKNAIEIFQLADTSFPDPAPTVDSGSCGNCLLTVLPFDGYPENVWDDDMELGATELYLALRSAHDLPPGIADADPMDYLRQAAQFTNNYVKKIYATGNSDTLNLYDVSGLAHFELYRALQMAGNPAGLAVSQSTIRGQLLDQVRAAISQAGTDAWGFGYHWNYGDTTSHGAGLAVMASEAYYLTGAKTFDTYSQRWLANILGANAWGSSFYCRGREHLPQLHSTSGGQLGWRAGWDFRRNADTVGCSLRRAGWLRDIRFFIRDDPVSGRWSQYFRNLQRQQRQVQHRGGKRLQGQYAVV